MKVFQKVLSASAVLLVLQGCAAGLSTKDAEQFQGSYLSGNYQQAADVVERELGFFDAKTQSRSAVVPTEANAVLLHLDAAENLRLAKNRRRAIEHYDAAEELFKEKDTENMGASAARNVGAVLTNDMALVYDPTPTEKILVNFYKALSFWADGDYANARVEFNRANERTRMAVERYSKQIEEARQEAEEAKKKANAGSINFSSFASNPKVAGSIGAWEVYDDFMNPTVAFTNALFLAAQDGPNSDNARVFMRRVQAMLGGNSERHPAFDYTDINDGYIWIIAETGLGPILTERRLDLPIPYDDNALILSLAFPNVDGRPNSVSLNRYTINNAQLSFTELADMNKLVRTEFSKRWPAIATRQVVSAFTKAAIQRTADGESVYLGLATKLFTVAVTKADTRIWTLTPQKWSVAKLKRPDNPVLTINYGAQILEVPIEPRSAIVYIKQPTGQAQPFVEVLPLSEAPAL